eukprot:CAMPEP_0203952744 /NCGR_PEP_ID=MMETSP0359-20131031/86310_1 /ASSEMBLY_ACC=CAM_ASM_000338 /TAXON_ID=268821 /ORGANISM="Scrippsiella Hangoei, Strain SHTV-5" /LENGTH=68 /DNA_ID=CAMNT_0050885839 /DNA_START=84 /DNA_END=290 /DNA_ORIENTATION=+
MKHLSTNIGPDIWGRLCLNGGLEPPLGEVPDEKPPKVKATHGAMHPTGTTSRPQCLRPTVTEIATNVG